MILRAELTCELHGSLSPSNTLCNDSNITGMSFDSSTGVLTWDPRNMQDGDYEFKVVATDNISIDTEYVNVNVADDDT